MKRAHAFRPTRTKLTITVGCFLIFPVVVALRAIPAEWDILNLREWSGGLLMLLVGVPIRGFDLLTGSAFASRSEGFLAFPSLPELGAALFADVLFFYILSCAWVHWRTRRDAA